MTKLNNNFIDFDVNKKIDFTELEDGEYQIIQLKLDICIALKSLIDISY